MNSYTSRPPLRSHDLRSLFAKSDAATERIGLEVESGVVDPETGLSASYAGKRGVESLLRTILAEWGGEGHYDGNHLTGVRLDGGAEITLEHGAQLEYSSAPADDLATAVDDMQTMMEQLSEIAQGFGLAIMPGANLPFDDLETASWVPIPRGAIMREFFTRIGHAGAGASKIMLLSLSTQTTLDYLSEEDFTEKLRMQAAASSVVAAILVNSPMEGGRVSGLLSQRSQHWLRMDPRRCGVLPPALREDVGFSDFTEWALQVPMIYYRPRGGEYQLAPDRSFASILESGFNDGTVPTWDDWISHLSQIWTGVRVRHTLELRAADGPPYAQIPAVPALWVGLSYHPQSRAAAWELLRHYSLEDHRATMWTLPIKGLRATLGSESVRELGRELLRFARAGLGARVAAGLDHPKVLGYLDPLEEVVSTGETFAEQCARRWEDEFNRSPSRYVAAYRV